SRPRARPCRSVGRRERAAVHAPALLSSMDSRLAALLHGVLAALRPVFAGAPAGVSLGPLPAPTFPSAGSPPWAAPARVGTRVRMNQPIPGTASCCPVCLGASVRPCLHVGGRDYLRCEACEATFLHPAQR